MFSLQFVVVKNLLLCNKNCVILSIKQYFSLKYTFPLPTFQNQYLHRFKSEIVLAVQINQIIFQDSMTKQ